MPLTRIQQRAIARLQQMACLDFNGPQLIEPVLHELHQVIGFDSGAYFYPGGQGGMDAYLEPSVGSATIHTYFEPEVMASERQVMRRSGHQFAEAVRFDHGPQVLEQLLAVPVSELLRSDFYNLTLLPAEVFDCLSLVLRTPQGEGLGTIKLYRSMAASRFGVRDLATLGRLEPWLARILQPGELDTQDSVVHDSAMLVTTPQGRLLWTSQKSNQLLAHAFGPSWHRRSELPPRCRLCCSACILRGGMVTAAMALRRRCPSWTCTTPAAGSACAPRRWPPQQAKARRWAFRSPTGCRAWRTCCPRCARWACRSASTSWPIGWRGACPKRRLPNAWGSAPTPPPTTAARFTRGWACKTGWSCKPVCWRPVEEPLVGRR